MAEKLTPQQQIAVMNRGGKLLVSAAAGSGKTKVLVDRLMSYITDTVAPANVDDFLIITYTKAAAAELRGKIAAKLSERMAQEPMNRHLQQQMQRLYLTKISTVHAFCADILREYAFKLDLSADFAVGDETQCRQLQLQAMEQVLDTAFENAEQDPDFRAFVDSQGFGRNDRQIPDILMKVYQSAMCHTDPDQWLDWCVSVANIDMAQDASETIWGKFLISDLQNTLDQHIDAMKKCADRAAVSVGMEKPAELLSQTLAQLVALRQCETWDAITKRKDIDFGRLTFSKKCTDLDLVECIKVVRGACKKVLESKLRVFSVDSQQVLRDLKSSCAAARGLVALTRNFRQAYDKRKQIRRVLDFSDLEQRTLDLLLGKMRSGPTSAAFEIGARFKEIMVDEYQDSNAVQDAIFSALTVKRQNCFMVGDVKQSIYQFRLADPGIFLEKYNSYCPTELAESGQGRKVLLSSNFRSSGGVISAVNDVFSACMSPEVGGISYTEDEMLHEGLPHVPLAEPEVEMHVVPVEADTYGEEAAFVAGRICELLDGTHMIRQGDGLRPIRPEDIVILLRSPGSVGGEFRYALEEKGLRCVSGGDLDLLQTEEIGVLRAILQIIRNPLQDIPLIAALASPVFGFTANDLAAIRSGNKRESMYSALQEDRAEKSRNFLKILTHLRKESRMTDLSQLLETIFNTTKMDSIYAAMPDGEAKLANLRTFCMMAADFETNGLRDLGQFLEYLDAVEEKGLLSSAEQNSAGAVTIMSIHKSKGLEFPVVFLCGLSRDFNKESARAQVLCDKDLGLGLSCVDMRNRVRYASIAKRAIAGKILSEGLSEEMRVLYVAMTRARDRLIMTYATKNPQNEISDMTARMNVSSKLLMTSEVTCPGQWVLYTALQRTEAGELFRLGGKAANTTVSAVQWAIHVASTNHETATPEASSAEAPALSAATIRKIQESIGFQYAHMGATLMPSKVTATQLKGRFKDQEVAENAQEPTHRLRSWRTPSFAGGTVQGKEYGTAMHAVMQHIDYGCCTDTDAVKVEIMRLVREGLITQEQGNLVDPEQIAGLFSTDLGKKIRSAKTVLREFKFSILEDCSKYSPEVEDEQVLMQGVVDCAILEEDGITVIDFKTDRVTDETIDEVKERYRSQIETYAGALSRIYQMPVKEKILYFFQRSFYVTL